MPIAGDRVIARHRLHQLVAHHVLDAKIERQLDRLERAAGGEARILQVVQERAVDVFLDPGDAADCRC